MPFIADEEIQKTQNKIDVEKRINKIIENHKINKTVEKQEQAHEKPSDAEMIQLIGKQQKKPKQITPDDIEKSLKIQEMIDKMKKEEIEKIIEDDEVSEIKNELIGVLALPMSIPERRRLFYAKLEKSKTINEYLNENVLFRWFNRANSHVKFTTIYGIKYLQTLGEYQQIQQIQKIQAEKIQKQAPTNPPIEKTNEQI